MKETPIPDLAIIGGTGLTHLHDLEITRREVVHTPYGEPSGAFIHGTLAGARVVFLARHGYNHRIPPHQVNYRANIWALHHIGVARVLAINAVGGIRAGLEPASLVIPDQLIDYTTGRADTFFENGSDGVVHTDFTRPYDGALRGAVLSAAERAGLRVSRGGVYAVMQGPRLETAAEIDRLERDGADVVGMTGMPEAVLAREKGLAYACCAVVSNRAAGRGGDEIRMAELQDRLTDGMAQVRRLLEHLPSSL